MTELEQFRTMLTRCDAQFDVIETDRNAQGEYATTIRLAQGVGFTFGPEGELDVVCTDPLLLGADPADDI